MADIKLKVRSGAVVNHDGIRVFQVPRQDGTIEEYISPTGNINITDTQITDVRGKATAQVVDANLKAENIAKGVSVLGIAGTHEGGGGEFPQLHAPTISISEDTLTITNPSNNGDFVTGYKILNNGAEVATVTDTTVDLTAVFTEANDYTVTVKAIGTNFADSVDSNAVDYTNIYYSVTYNLTNCTSNNTATQVRKNGSYKATIIAESGYDMSSGNASITMGGSVLSGVYANGKIKIPSVTGELVITAEAGQSYIITVGNYLGKTGLTNRIPINITGLSLSIVGRSSPYVYTGDSIVYATHYNDSYLYYLQKDIGTLKSRLCVYMSDGWAWNFVNTDNRITVNTDKTVTKEQFEQFFYYFDAEI